MDVIDWENVLVIDVIRFAEGVIIKVVFLVLIKSVIFRGVVDNEIESVVARDVTEPVVDENVKVNAWLILCRRFIVL